MPDTNTCFILNYVFKHDFIFNNFLQQRARDLRETRRHLFKPVHKHLMQLVADHIRLDYVQVEDFVLDSERV